MADPEPAKNATHTVFNQSPPYGGINLFATDPLLDLAVSGFPDGVRQDLIGHGAFWGSHEARDIAQKAPGLKGLRCRAGGGGRTSGGYSLKPGL